MAAVQRGVRDVRHSSYMNAVCCNENFRTHYRLRLLAAMQAVFAECYVSLRALEAIMLVGWALRQLCFAGC